MKKTPQQPAGSKNKDQSNIGYENTQIRSDRDDKEQQRVQTTDTGHNEGPKEDKDDTAGLRSESGKKTLGKEAGNKKKK